MNWSWSCWDKKKTEIENCDWAKKEYNAPTTNIFAVQFFRDGWMNGWMKIYFSYFEPFLCRTKYFFSKKKFNNEYIIIHEDKTFWIFYLSFIGFYQKLNNFHSAYIFPIHQSLNISKQFELCCSYYFEPTYIYWAYFEHTLISISRCKYVHNTLSFFELYRHA